MLHIVIFSDDSIHSKRYRSTNLKNNRGNILDRNGIILATDIATKSLYANPKLIKNHNKTADFLSKMFEDLDYDIIKRKILQNSKKA